MSKKVVVTDNQNNEEVVVMNNQYAFPYELCPECETVILLKTNEGMEPINCRVSRMTDNEAVLECECCGKIHTYQTCTRDCITCENPCTDAVQNQNNEEVVVMNRTIAGPYASERTDIDILSDIAQSLRVNVEIEVKEGKTLVSGEWTEVKKLLDMIEPNEEEETMMCEDCGESFPAEEADTYDGELVICPKCMEKHNSKDVIDTDNMVDEDWARKPIEKEPEYVKVSIDDVEYELKVSEVDNFLTVASLLGHEIDNWFECDSCNRWLPNSRRGSVEEGLLCDDCTAEIMKGLER